MIPNRDISLEQRQTLFASWEQARDPVTHRLFYVDHNTKTTTWLNPIDKLIKPQRVMDCSSGELPYGWEQRYCRTGGTYYANHLEGRNQWTNPVDDWRLTLFSHHHYSNSQTVFSIKQSGNSLDSNNQTTSQTTADTKPDVSLHASSDIDDKFTTSLNNSNTLSTEIIDNMRSQNDSTRGSRYDAGLLDIMDNCYGRKSSQSVEV